MAEPLTRSQENVAVWSNSEEALPPPSPISRSGNVEIARSAGKSIQMSSIVTLMKAQLTPRGKPPGLSCRCPGWKGPIAGPWSPGRPAMAAPDWPSPSPHLLGNEPSALAAFFPALVHSRKSGARPPCLIVSNRCCEGTHKGTWNGTLARGVRALVILSFPSMEDLEDRAVRASFNSDTHCSHTLAAEHLYQQVEVTSPTDVGCGDA